MKSKAEHGMPAWITLIRTRTERDSVASLLVMSLQGTVTAAMIRKTLESVPSDLQQEVISLFSSRPTRKEVFALMSQLEQLPVVACTLAFVPREQAIIRWHTLCMRSLGTPCVLSITQEVEIGAGALVEVKGRVFDYRMFRL